MLRNAMAAVFGAELSERALRRADIDGERRGETLTVAELARLAAAVDLEA